MKIIEICKGSSALSGVIAQSKGILQAVLRCDCAPHWHSALRAARKILLVPIILSLLACGELGTPTPPDSGITGQALVGPVCPVAIEGRDCPDRPYQATMTVNSLEGREIVRFQTDEEGNFNVPLLPGEYILHPKTPNGQPFPSAEKQPFTVLPGEYTRLIVLYDSGIR